MAQKESSYWDAIEPIWDVVNFYGDEETYLASIANLDRRLVLLYAAHWAYSEISNGGFTQFFWNSTGAVGPEAMEGYRLIGMPQIAALIERVFGFLGFPYPRDRVLRQRALFSASGCDEAELKKLWQNPRLSLDEMIATPESPLNWNALNREFFKLMDAENGGFEVAANRYVSLHKLGPGN